MSTFPQAVKKVAKRVWPLGAGLAVLIVVALVWGIASGGTALVLWVMP
jgi:hypothetical protein